MARPKAKAPSRRYHMSGQSVVTIAGRDFYLGPHDSPEAIAPYAALVTFYQQHDLTLPDEFDLATLDPQVAVMLGQSPMTATQQTDEAILVRDITSLYRDPDEEELRRFDKQRKNKSVSNEQWVNPNDPDGSAGGSMFRSVICLRRLDTTSG